MTSRVTYRYDDAGRVIEAVVEQDPAFTSADADEALALYEVDGERCSGCGQVRAEAWDPRGEREGWWVAEARVCHACAEIERDAAARRESGVPPATQAATRYVVGRKGGGG